MWSAVATAASRASVGDWLLLVAALLLLSWLLGTWSYDFFTKRGVASSRPAVPFLGNTVPAFIGFKSFPDLLLELYREGKGHSVYGIFEFQRPIFMIRDPDLIKVVAVKDFDNFMNHRSLSNEKSDPLFGTNLFNLRDQRWRDMRSTLSPAFTTSKIKAMFPLIQQCTRQMADHLRQKYNSSAEGSNKKPLPVDMKDLFSRMANDVIATVAFGVGCDSLANPENQFYKMGKEMTTFNFIQGLIFLAYASIPKVAQFLGLRVLSVRASNYFDSLVRETVSERLKQGIFRPDMLQLLMQARQGQLKADAADEHERERLGSAKTVMTDQDVSAQAIIFFFAGFETVSTALCFTAYELSHNPEVQKRLQQEVDAVWEKTGGKPTYEDIQGMKYLDAVINEGLRMHPPVVASDRQCLSDTVLPPTEHSGPSPVRKGDIVWVPTFALHHDPELWEDPERFDPERFNEENKHKIKPFTYAPFGLGPRLCIGQRFALVEVKLALASLIANFELAPSTKTKFPLKYKKGFNMMVEGGFWSNLVPRSS